jgi:isoamylase
MKQVLLAGRPTVMGARFDGDGTNFAVFSENATQIDLCIFAPDGKRELSRTAFPECTGPVWHGYAPGLKPGCVYGFRAYGDYAPEQGHRFNPNKLLLDPYTYAFCGSFQNDRSLLGYDANSTDQDLSFSTVDSAPFMAKSIVPDPGIYAHIDRPLSGNLSETLIYEAHVKGLTREHPGVPGPLRGTYEGLASDAMIDHLHKLGVTAIELLPVHSFLDDAFLQARGLRNYWGYNTVSFFAPEPRYFGPKGLAGFRAMVGRFHAAGIEVILDVVYNHTAEGDHLGPTLCYRGLDNASYYRLTDDQPRYYVNDTGCGNTVNVDHPYVLRMVMDSLRFWVQAMGIDGFRFDLATTLGRESHGFDPAGGFFDALRQDPVLAGVKLIAEPWDIGPGGYQLGEFPPEFSEWNDTFRDSLRKYWRGDDNSAQDLAARLLGSADQFDRNRRRAWSSVNLITAHDGFTLADLTRYNQRHNAANGEDGQDGHGANYSDNCGVEGASDDADILAQRARRQRNLLATLFLSQGTPMMLAGDEIGNSQGGNNNAYCQDNATGWINWDQADTELSEFVSALSKFRRSHSVLRQTHFLHGHTRAVDGLPDVEWFGFDGTPLQWGDPGLSNLCLVLRCSAEAAICEQDDDTVCLVFNREMSENTVKLPAAPQDRHWIRAIDTAAEQMFALCEIDPDAVILAAHSVAAFVLKEDRSANAGG